jgi:Fe-S-cluster containining protein
VQFDVQVSPSAEGPKLKLSCPDRTSVVPLAQLIGSLRTLTSKVVEVAAERERGAGREVSCKAGCGACCRQLVPISRVEAREMPSLIAGLGEAHRSRVMARFADAIARLRASPVWERLERYASLPFIERQALSLDYFQLGIACPFLENESCSIHPDRPLICREYLVTSPAQICGRVATEGEKIVRVALAAHVFGALGRLEARERGALSTVPLVLAPSMDFDDDERKMTAPEWVGLLMQEIGNIREERVARLQADEALEAGQKLPDAGAGPAPGVGGTAR